MTRRRLAVTAALLCLAGVWLPASSAWAQQSAQVRVVDNAYDPGTAAVAVGGEVTWTWVGTGIHTVTARDSSFQSNERTNGATFSHTFPTEGTFGYFCEIHGDAMSGVIEVRRAAPAPTTAAPRPTPTARPTTARPSPSSAPPSSAPPSPAPLPSPTATSPTPTPSVTAVTTAPAASPAPSAAASSAPAATRSAPARTSAPLVTLDEPTPKDRSGLAIALGLAVAALGFGTAGALLLRRTGDGAAPPVE